MIGQGTDSGSLCVHQQRIDAAIAPPPDDLAQIVLLGRSLLPHIILTPLAFTPTASSCNSLETGFG
jgi:hypothetical protein